jgi:hypothetical protein
MSGWLPVQASSHAAEIDWLMTLVHLLMLVLFAGWGAYFVWVLYRFGRRRQPGARPEGARGRLALGVEIGVVVAEALLLVVIALPLWYRQTSAQPLPGEATVIRVVGEQFVWNGHYPGADGRFGETSVALVSMTNPVGLDRSSRFGADDIVVLGDIHVPVKSPGGDPAVEQGRDPQLRGAGDAGEAGRDPGHAGAALVHADRGGTIRHRVLAALRHRAPPHARRADGRVERRVCEVAGGRGSAAEVGRTGLRSARRTGGLGFATGAAELMRQRFRQGH